MSAASIYSTMRRQSPKSLPKSLRPSSLNTIAPRFTRHQSCRSLRSWARCTGRSKCGGLSFKKPSLRQVTDLGDVCLHVQSQRFGWRSIGIQCSDSPHRQSTSAMPLCSRSFCRAAWWFTGENYDWCPLKSKLSRTAGTRSSFRAYSDANSRIEGRVFDCRRGCAAWLERSGSAEILFKFD